MIEPREARRFANSLAKLTKLAKETIEVLEAPPWLASISIVDRALEKAKENIALLEEKLQPYEHAKNEINKRISPEQHVQLLTLEGVEKAEFRARLDREIIASPDGAQLNEQLTDGAYASIDAIYNILPTATTRGFAYLSDRCLVRGMVMCLAQSGDPSAIGKEDELTRSIVTQYKYNSREERDYVTIIVEIAQRVTEPGKSSPQDSSLVTRVREAALEVQPEKTDKDRYFIKHEDPISDRLRQVDSNIRPMVACLVASTILNNLVNVYLHFYEEIKKTREGDISFEDGIAGVRVLAGEMKRDILSKQRQRMRPLASKEEPSSPKEEHQQPSTKISKAIAFIVGCFDFNDYGRHQ